MITRKTGGSIILTASMAGHIVNYPQTHVAYGTSKAGVQHMTHCLAAEWASHGIRVNSLSPGYMDTRLNASEDLTDVLPTWFERTPMGRMGNKEELIGPVVLLASSAGSFMTGSDLRIDGKISRVQYKDPLRLTRFSSRRLYPFLREADHRVNLFTVLVAI